jgi:DNA-binding XRE family transcriptional regulator
MDEVMDPDDRLSPLPSPPSPASTRRAHALTRGSSKLAYTSPRLSTAHTRAVEQGDVRRSTLREIRLAQGLTAEALASRSGVSATTIFRIEGGKTSPRSHIVRRICTALEYAPWDVEEFAASLRRSISP